MKKLLPIVMSIMMLMALLSFALHTASADTSGTCGNNLTWCVKGTVLLTTFATRIKQ